MFADWLDERGDPRAEGYRALAAGRYVLCDRYTGTPLRYVPKQTSRIFRDDGSNTTGRDYTLPADWFAGLQPLGEGSVGGFVGFANRRAAEDAAALAFSRLTPERRRELMAGRDGM